MVSSQPESLCWACVQTSALSVPNSWGFCSSSARSLWMMFCYLSAIPLNLIQAKDLLVLHFHPHWFPFWLPNCISTALLFLNIFLGLLSSGFEYITSLCEDPWPNHSSASSYVQSDLCCPVLGSGETKAPPACTGVSEQTDPGSSWMSTAIHQYSLAGAHWGHIKHMMAAV